MESDEQAFLSELADEPQLIVAAYPNPFTSTTTIVFERTDKADRAVVEIYTSLGRLVRRLFDAQIEQAVEYRVQFNAEDLPNGIYMFRVITSDRIDEGRLILNR